MEILFYSKLLTNNFPVLKTLAAKITQYCKEQLYYSSLVIKVEERGQKAGLNKSIDADIREMKHRY